MGNQEEEIVTITPEFHEAMDLIETSGKDPVFITGSAGTGKSTLLQMYRDSIEKKLVCLAPTGVAALHVKGQTIHSFFGFPPRLLQAGNFKIWKNKRLIKQLEMIIIDEISMVRADLLDAIDYYLRSVRKSESPFGGIKMVFFGDLYQLPPVVRGIAEANYFSIEYDSPYFFSAMVLQKDCSMQVFELNTVFRQKDKSLVELLNRIRTSSLEMEDLERINCRCDPGFIQPELCVTLAARNAVVSAINKTKLAELEGDPQLYEAKIKGKISPTAYPSESVLALKPGAQVIFLRNDPDNQFVNGTLGKVAEVAKDHVLVLIGKKGGEEKMIEVEPFKWDMVEYEFDTREKKVSAKTVGEFIQYPLKLAWALTIHKSQGKSFDQVFIDLSRGGAFESGQAYVALSRCRSWDGIVLKQPLSPSDIKIDQRIVEFFQYDV